MEIVLTMGNTDDIAKHKTLIDNIINSESQMVRCCVSKASFDEHLTAINMVKDLFYEKTGKHLAVMLDVAIPKDKCRISLEGELDLSQDDSVILSNSPNTVLGNDLPVIYTDADLEEHELGDEYIIGDSLARLVAVEYIGLQSVKCRVTNLQATIKNGLGIASQKGCIKTTNRDIYDKCIKLIECVRPECIVLSYIENKDDVDEFRNAVVTSDYAPCIMSKIETYAAVKNRNEIIQSSDELMIARGCLAVNVGLENLLQAQNAVIAACKAADKKVCIASNILKSIGSQAAPTRTDMIDLAYMMQQGVSFLVITDSISRTPKYRALYQYVKRAEEALENQVF